MEYLKKKQKLFVIPDSFHFRRIIGVKDADLIEKLRSGDPNARIIAESWHRFNGFSLVHCLTQGRASSLKAIEALEYLFYKGANVNNTDERGFTSLDILTRVMALHSTMIANGLATSNFKFYEKIKCLVQHGADYSTKKGDANFSNQEIIEEVYTELGCEQCLKQWWPSPLRNEDKYAMCSELKKIRELFKEQDKKR